MRALILTTVALLFLTGCKKDKHTRYTVQGHLYEDCGMAPLANVHLELRDDYAYGYPHSDLEVSATTDASGFFSFNYESNNAKDGLTISAVSDLSSGTLLQFVPVNQNITVDVFHQYNEILSLTFHFNSPHTNLDTLYYFAYSNSPAYQKILGPFTDTTVSILMSSPWLGNFPAYKQKESVILFWGLGYNDFQASHNSFYFGEDYHIVTDTLEHCQTNETIIAID